MSHKLTIFYKEFVAKGASVMLVIMIQLKCVNDSVQCEPEYRIITFVSLNMPLKIEIF